MRQLERMIRAFSTSQRPHADMDAFRAGDTVIEFVTNRMTTVQSSCLRSNDWRLVNTRTGPEYMQMPRRCIVRITPPDGAIGRWDQHRHHTHELVRW